jgi:penicillin-binding protein 1A
MAVLALWLSTPSAGDLQQRVARIASADGTRELAPDEVPPLLATALVSIEDERFYSHHGIDSIGLARALVDDVRYVCLCEGGSTISEQVADMAYYAGSGRGQRKLPSMTVGVKIEFRYSKQQILADYLSIVPSGYGVNGMPAAACAYFHHSLANLSLAEAAELAGMPQAPSLYDPRYHPEAARARRSAVLHQMRWDGYISASEQTAAEDAPVTEAGSGCTGA